VAVVADAESRVGNYEKLDQRGSRRPTHVWAGHARRSQRTPHGHRLRRAWPPNVFHSARRASGDERTRADEGPAQARDQGQAEGSQALNRLIFRGRVFRTGSQSGRATGRSTTPLLCLRRRPGRPGPRSRRANARRSWHIAPSPFSRRANG